MEEENGELVQAESVLLRGLEQCALNVESEALIVKALRIEEKCGHVDLVRHTLSALRHVDLSQHWRVMLEGALFGMCHSKYTTCMLMNVLLQSCELVVSRLHVT